MNIMVFCLAMLALGCGDADASPSPTSGRYVLGSVVIGPENNRTTYVQVIDSLDGPFDNSTAIELPGNGVVMAGNGRFFVGLAEEPTWVAYEVNARGEIEEVGRMSLANYGLGYIDYGNALIDQDAAVSVISDPPVAVFWNPSTMEIIGDVELRHLIRDGYSLEVWTTVAHEGRVYIPGRWANWDEGRIYAGVSMTILDPSTMGVIGTATDDRCASGGRVVFDAEGYAYVMGDGRNYAIQMYANAAGTPESAPDNCLLRIAPGQTVFEADYFHTIPSLTGGLQSITELETGMQGSGVAYSKMFDPSRLAEGTTATDFGFWDQPAHKLWRIDLGDTPTAREVQGAPYSAIGFGGSSFAGRLYVGESDTSTTDVYEVDTDTNTSTLRFTMDGYFYGLYALTP